MKMMTAIFYFKDGTKLKIEGNSGSYNSLTKEESIILHPNIII